MLSYRSMSTIPTAALNQIWERRSRCTTVLPASIPSTAHTRRASSYSSGCAWAVDVGRASRPGIRPAPSEKNSVESPTIPRYTYRLLHGEAVEVSLKTKTVARPTKTGMVECDGVPSISWIPEALYELNLIPSPGLTSLMEPALAARVLTIARISWGGACYHKRSSWLSFRIVTNSQGLTLEEPHRRYSTRLVTIVRSRGYYLKGFAVIPLVWDFAAIQTSPRPSHL